MAKDVMNYIKLDYNSINLFINRLHKLIIYITTIINFVLFILLIFNKNIILLLLEYTNYINFYNLNFNYINIAYKILVLFYIISKITLYVSFKIFLKIGKYREIKNPYSKGDENYINYISLYAKLHNNIMFSFIHRCLEIIIIPFFIFNSLLYMFNILDNYLFYYNKYFIMFFVLLFLIINSILSFRYCFYSVTEEKEKD